MIKERSTVRIYYKAFLIVSFNNLCKKCTIFENQDGGVGAHTAPPRTTRADGKSNGRGFRHQVDKKETYIQTGGRGGDTTGAERTLVAMAGPRLVECGTNGAGSPTPSIR